jgi:hypothetical protein
MGLEHIYSRAKLICTIYEIAQGWLVFRLVGAVRKFYNKLEACVAAGRTSFANPMI